MWKYTISSNSDAWLLRGGSLTLIRVVSMWPGFDDEL